MSIVHRAPPVAATRPPRRARALLAGVVCVGLAACEPPVEPGPRDPSDADAFTGDIGDMGDLDPVDAVPDAEPGSEGAGCRPMEPACDLALRCVQGTCVLPGPGERDQPCRPAEPLCDGGLVCDGGVCRVDPECPEACDVGHAMCAEGEIDGYRVCGGRLEDDCTAYGTNEDEPVIVPCDPGRTCRGGRCEPIEDGTRASPEFALLVDRGIDPVEWPAWRDAIVGWVRAVQPAIAVGAQTFPGEAPCLGGRQARVSRNDSTAIADLLALPPPADLGRPLATVLGRAGQLLGSPNEGQYAVLITTGDENCEDGARFVRLVRYLRGQGVRTRIIRVGGRPDEARDAVLDAAGYAGGLFDVEADGGAYRDVESPSDLREALDALARQADPACVDLDGDGRGPFCRLGTDCEPHDDTAYAGAPEACDGVDDDCDGLVDEGLAPMPARLTEGPCAGLEQRCVDGAWTEPNYAAEVPGYEHSAELTCDGVDNDCDGATDEALGDRAGACSVGLGVCAAEGVYVCDRQSPGHSVCDARPGMPGPERCNGADDDCDGMVDEDAPPAERAEACNGVDDDCDDAIDEDVDLALCGQYPGQIGLDCRQGTCDTACAADRRDAEGDPGCEAPGYGQLALGDGFTCLVDPRDGPTCYGSPDAPIAPLGDVGALAAGGSHVCALFAGGVRDGEIECAGPPGGGADVLAEAVAGRYTAVGIGDRIGCALTPAGEVTCWSPEAGSSGQFGAGRRATRIAVGGRHVCALDAEGEARCYGACRVGCQFQGAAPAAVRFASLSAGAFHNCGITRPDGALRCWGAGAMPCVGQICGEHQGQSIPLAGQGYRAVAAGNLHTCAINRDFRVVCWGSMADGRTAAPAGRFSAIWAGGDHTCARRFDGHVICWGLDTGGETDDLH